MKLVTCECPKCGSLVKLNESLEMGKCNLCGCDVYNEYALKKEKMDVSGRVVVDDIDILKEIDNAVKYYSSKECDDAIRTLERVLLRDPFNYDALKLYITYIFNIYSENTLYDKSEEIISCINKFKTIKKTEEDNNMIKKYSNKINDIIYKYKKESEYKSLRGKIIGLLICAVFCYFLFCLSREEVKVEDSYRVEIKDGYKKINVNDIFYANAKVYNNGDEVDMLVKWRSQPISTEFGDITSDGVITAKKVGHYYYCVELVDDISIYDCNAIDIVAPCQDSYTFSNSGLEKTLTSGYDFCSGTYEIVINSVLDPNKLYDYYINGGAHMYWQNDNILDKTYTYTFHDNNTLKFDSGITNVTLIKK